MPVLGHDAQISAPAPTKGYVQTGTGAPCPGVTVVLYRSGIDGFSVKVLNLHCASTHRRTHTTFHHELEFFILRPQEPMGDDTRWGLWETTITRAPCPGTKSEQALSYSLIKSHGTSLPIQTALNSNKFSRKKLNQSK